MYYCVIDVGGSKIKHALMTHTGEIIESDSISTPNNIDEFIDVVGNIVDEYKKQYKIEGLAASLPCVIDPKTSKAYGTSAVHYLITNDTYSLLKERTNLKVALENDGNCAGIAEGHMGSAKDCYNYVVLVIGSGIGGSVFINNSIVYGKHLYCGEFGMGIMNDPLKAQVGENISTLVSTSALIKNVSNALGVPLHQIDGKKIFEMADAGNLIVLDELKKHYKRFATLVYNIQFFLDPEKILLGGGISENKKFIDGVNKALFEINVEQSDFEIKVEACKFYNQANLLGALFNFQVKNK